MALSDCNDIGAIFSSGIAANHSQAAAMALKAGVDWDLQCGTESQHWGYYNYLKEAIELGLVDEATLDTTVMRVLVQKFGSNLWDTPYTDVAGAGTLDAPAHRALALDAATQSLVLLQNANQTLPMALEGKKIALFGPLSGGGDDGADKDSAVTALVGSYVLSGAPVVTVADALGKVRGAEINYVRGCDATGFSGAGCPDLEGAIAAAKAADVAVLVLGDGDRDCGEWHDRDNLDLAGGQLSLLQAIAGVAPKTIVVLVHGRPQTFGLGNAVLAKVDALIAAWRSGEEVREWFFPCVKCAKMEITGHCCARGRVPCFTLTIPSFPSYLAPVPRAGCVRFIGRERHRQRADRRKCAKREAVAVVASDRGSGRRWRGPVAAADPRQVGRKRKRLRRERGPVLRRVRLCLCAVNIAQSHR